MKKIVAISFFVFAFTVINAQENAFEKLCGYMTGSFSSEGQSLRDTNYYDIRLHMVHVWDKRQDGYWLYVEQAVSSMQEKPYRQRFYRVHQLDENTFESEVYELNEPSAVIHAWDTPEKLTDLTPEDLILRDGCSITLHWNNAGFFEGKTSDADCSSNLRGASYATSEAKIYKNRLESWDRGFNAEGKQVWGAESGAYVFDKIHDDLD